MNLNEHVIFENPRPVPTVHTEFPSIIDNTARETWTACPTKFRRQVINKLSRTIKSPDLHFGAAFAIGLETYRREAFGNGQPDKSALASAVVAATRFYGDFTPPEGHLKTYERLLEALEAYVNKYPSRYDHIRPYQFPSGELALEFSFAIPLPIAHPETGDPLIYAGRFDMIGVFNNQLFVFDDKTTSRLGPTWSNQWRSTSQLTGYCWAARNYGLPIVGAIIRGQSILTRGCEFAEVIQYRSTERIDQWYEQLLEEIQDMITAWKRGHFRKSFNASCNAYNGCAYLDICLAQDESLAIESGYQNHYWNPLDREPIKELADGV